MTANRCCPRAPLALLTGLLLLIQPTGARDGSGDRPQTKAPTRGPSAAPVRAAPGMTGPQLRLQWYEQLVAMKKTGSFRDYRWQFLGPTNISGRVTDVAVVTPRGQVLHDLRGDGDRRRLEDRERRRHLEAGLRPGDVDVDRRRDRRAVRIRTSSGSAPARPTSSAARRPALASTSRPTPARPGSTWDWPARTRFRASSSTRRTPTSCTWRHRATSGRTTRSAASTRPPTAARRGRRCCSSTRRPAPSTWSWIPSTPNTLYAATWQRIRSKWNDPRNEPGYSGQRHPQDDRRRADLDADQRRAAARRSVRGRIGIDVCRSKPNVLYAFVDNYEIARQAKPGELDAYGRQRAAGHQGRRGLPVRRQGRRRGGRSASRTTYMERLRGDLRLGVRPDPRRSDRREHDLHHGARPERVHATAARRSSALRRHARRSPRAVDRPGQPELPRQRQRRRRRRVLRPGQDVAAVPRQPAGRASSSTCRTTWTRRSTSTGRSRTTAAGAASSTSSRGRDRIAAVGVRERAGRRGQPPRDRPEQPEHRLLRRLLRQHQPRGPGEDRRAGQSQRQSVTPRLAPADGRLRGQWLAPIMLSPHNPDVLYHGGQYVFRSWNRGDTWERISPDLTDNDPEQDGRHPVPDDLRAVRVAACASGCSTRAPTTGGCT